MEFHRWFGFLRTGFRCCPARRDGSRRRELSKRGTEVGLGFRACGTVRRDLHEPGCGHPRRFQCRTDASGPREVTGWQAAAAGRRIASVPDARSRSLGLEPREVGGGGVEFRREVGKQVRVPQSETQFHVGGEDGLRQAVVLPPELVARSITGNAESCSPRPSASRRPFWS